MDKILQQILQGINELKGEVSTLKGEITDSKEQQAQDMQKIDTRLKAMNERLDSFKFDTDFIVQKQAQQEMELNRINKRLES
ncbi:hypothetical protein [Alkalihalobacillus sp. TS-13]|uniref:hypothetical protein n=1 Tax=Alkalihalobacillus sp. TS-13 TaxID=2842455 RepID=UPI001C877BAB|nr:hypothetical protein [Alkalihalobacillus sp. TS-13]